MADSGISGLGLTLAASGGVLLVAAIRNESPVSVLKAAIGRPTPATPISRPFGEVVSGVAVVGRAGKFAEGGTGTLTPAGSGGALVEEARRHIGAPYVWATAGPTTFDCSGLVVYCLRKIGQKPPRFTTYTFGSWAKSQGWTKVSADKIRGGDVIVRTGHMGIAVSASEMIHAPHPGAKVRYSNIYDRSSWWGWRMSGGN